MTATVAEHDLPVDLSPFAAVEAAYPEELERARTSVRRGLPVLLECDKGLTPFFYKCLRDRLKQDGFRCAYLDGRPAAGDDDGGMPQGMMATMIGQLRDAVRGAVESRVVVLPHLDLLTSAHGGLTSESREVIPLLYENPNIMWLGFKDPSFPLPTVIRNLFPHHESILGVSRERLRFLVTQREARKLGRGLNPYRLYKHVSGVHAVRLRRVLASLSGEDYPSDPRAIWRQLRSATLASNLSLPDLKLHEDIGGYDRVKQKIQREILDVITYKESLGSPAAIERVEKLIPRGMIFSGPPGTGKTLFAKAIAAELGAAVTVVSGPELKSRWVGESEENLRHIFTSARKAAPAVIIFDELDSFASARGTYTGSGVEHSMVNQLLTELDGFRDNEMVFVVGTTNFVESLDPALLRPGRMEFHLTIPYPGADDRRAIFQIYDKKLDLQLSDEALEYAVRQSGFLVEGGHSRYSGDHIYALCRAVARRRLRENNTGESSAMDVQRALEDNMELPSLTSHEEKVIATHEAGHAVVALHCDHVPPIERISIRGDVAGALGFVSYADPAHRYVTTRKQLLDGICTLFGGREAEQLLLDDLSIGSGHDLERATDIARALVERFGMGSDELVRDFTSDGSETGRGPGLSDSTQERLDRVVGELLTRERDRSQDLLKHHRSEVVVLRDLLLKEKVLDARAISTAVAPKGASEDG